MKEVIEANDIEARKMERERKDRQFIEEGVFFTSTQVNRMMTKVLGSNGRGEILYHCADEACTGAGSRSANIPGKILLTEREYSVPVTNCYWK